MFACLYAEIAIPLLPGIPLTVLDDVPVATVDPLPSTPTLPPDPPECVARYAQYLKDKYKRMPTLPEGDWPPSLGRQYSRLAMIEQERELPGAELVATMERDYIHGNIDNIVKRKKPIQLCEVFLPTEGEQQLKVLMDGAPGVGKSTLSRKICKDWASGELLQQYHLVILLPLRQASIREATYIDGLIEADDPDLKQQVVRHIQETSGEHVLLIVDGYDELSYKDRTQDSFFLDVVKGMKFSKCSVLVTSRPYASDYLQQLQSINRHVEVLGFTEEQIEHCIIDNIPDKTKATELVQTLKERQDIASLCYIPLNCAIVLYVYEREQCTLPSTLTKLYEIFILNAVKRQASITGNDPRSIRRLHTLPTLPEQIQRQLSALGKLAYDSLVTDRMVFSIDDLEAAFPDCRDLDIERSLLGLMTAFKEFISTGGELSYQFLHLTIQEFLAARWAASQLSAGELFKFIQDHLREERYRMVLLFIAGISQLNFPSADKLHFEHHYTKEFLFLSHLIYESQNFSLFHDLATAINGAKLSLSWCYMLPFDCLVLAHFLTCCDCAIKLLNLRACGLTNQSLEIMHRVNLEHPGTTHIEEVNLSYNPEIITNVPLLPKLPMFEHTRKLTVNGLQYTEGMSHDQVAFHCVLNMRHLTTLEISVKEILDSSEVEYSLSLDKMVLRCRNGNRQDAVGIFSLLEHNTSLEEVDLLGNWQLAEGDSEAVGCAIEKMLNVNKTLEVLNLSGYNVTDPLAKHIASGLTKNTSLVTLDMGSPILSGSCAVCLLQQITTHPTLNITVVELNVLGVGRVKMDRGCLWCVIGVTIPENCVEFFRALHDYCMTVSILNVVDLTDQTAEHFAVGLAESQSVQALDLRANSISSTGAVSIFRSLEHNTSLEDLDLSENSQLAEGDCEAVGCAIERMLNVNRTLKALNLSGCQVTDPIVKHILAGLTKNMSLMNLNMGSCTLRVKCAVPLFQQITNHPTPSISAEVNVLGVGMVKIDREILGCVINYTSDKVPEKFVELFRALNDSGVKVSNVGVSLGRALLHAAEEGHIHIMKYLIEEQGCDPSCLKTDKGTPLHRAAYKGHLDIVKFLTLGKHCNPASRNCDGTTPIHCAAQHGQLEILKFFITDLKSSPNIPGQYGRTPLHYAAEGGHLHIMKYLIDEQGCDPSCLKTDKGTPLHRAAYKGHLDIVKFLTLEKHCNPASRNCDGTTPIHCAAQYGHLEILKFFITDLKSSPNIPGQYGGTPLHNAAEKGHLHIVKYLIDEQQCDPSCLNKDKGTPLHCAAYKGRLDVVKFLTLEKHCNPNQRDIWRNTALHYAARKGHLQVVQFFVEELKCSPNIRGRDNATPRQRAETMGHHNVALYLQKFQHSTN